MLTISVSFFSNFNALSYYIRSFFLPIFVWNHFQALVYIWTVNISSQEFIKDICLFIKHCIFYIHSYFKLMSNFNAINSKIHFLELIILVDFPINFMLIIKSVPQITATHLGSEINRKYCGLSFI